MTRHLCPCHLSFDVLNKYVAGPGWLDGTQQKQQQQYRSTKKEKNYENYKVQDFTIDDFE